MKGGETMKAFLSNLKLKRLQLRMTQGEVAVKAGISQAYLSHLENGREVLRDKIMSRLAEIYSCNVEDLR